MAGRAGLNLGRTEAVDAGIAVGWRVWRVGPDGLLRSVVYDELWPAGRPVHAECRKLAGGHAAPDPRCECGLYAAKNLADWVHYLGRPDRIFGRVLLAGALVEAARGFRASAAYPLELVVPALVENPDAVADALAVYGVPVEVPVVGAVREAA
jgi:hypothetical protein